MRSKSSAADVPLLSPSEFRIFSVLREGPLTIRDIGQTLAGRDPDFNQTASALGVLLQRMVRKGYVAQEGRQRAKHYRALLPYTPVVQRHIDSFLSSLNSPQELRMLIEAAVARLVPESLP